PKYITKYIVENTVGKLCNEKKKELEINDEDYISSKQFKTRKILSNKLAIYREWLQQLTICDPACGSGAFLNQALEFLIHEHIYIDELDTNLLKDKNKMVIPQYENFILENNLYGVDINEGAIEIAKLSLWLRTIRKDRKLSDLSNNIKVGNSLIDDKEVAGDLAFNWEENFPEVFAKGGFDVVIGNPPYAGRSSSINETEKLYIRNRFNTSEGKFELYQLFIEKCFILVKNQKGFISLITPQTWLSIIQAIKLRKLTFANKELFEIVFLGKNVFEDASVDSIVFIVSCGVENSSINFLQSNNLLNIERTNSTIPYTSIDNTTYIIPLSSDKKSLKLIDKIKAKAISLEKIGTWSDGFKIVGNAKTFAFQKTKVDDTFFPMLVGKDIERFAINWGGLYCCRSKKVIEKHNATDIRLRVESMFIRNKILIRKTGNEIVATKDTDNYYNEQSLFSYGLDNEKYSLNSILGILNSQFANFLLKENAFSKKDTFPQIRLHWLKEFPIPIKIISTDNQNPFIEKVDTMLNLSKTLQIKVSKFTKFIKREYNLDKLNKKLNSFYKLSLDDFIKEIQKIANLKSASALENRKLSEYWEEMFAVDKNEILILKFEIDKTDEEIDQMVYKLYELTDDEIKIVEENAKCRL
ncbi:MAG: N-6 DNA methylase, partial [Bacteroidales bacterium]|nr:N-6 DNA methylase [Bacteroidales bacterium]